MATIHVTFRSMVDLGGSSLPGEPRASESLTSSTTSAATNIEAMLSEVATITALGGSVYVSYGRTDWITPEPTVEDEDPAPEPVAPVAIAGTGDLLLEGQTLMIAGLPAGTRIAVINPAA